MTQFNRHRLVAVLAIVASSAGLGTSPSVIAQESYQRISGEGSTWSANAIDDMRTNVAQFGITVDYAATGSTSGRRNYLNGTVDFAASDIPFVFEPEDGSQPENPEPNSYVYIPVTAGGTAFMYNLKINGQQVTNLRLSGANVARIFTGEATVWNDPEIQADNPGITLPARPIVPVVRSDGSGSTAQFTKWMIDRHPSAWQSYCANVGRANCGFTSFYPTIPSMKAQPGDTGVAGYVAAAFGDGAIGYVNYSYALNSAFPVAKVLNSAGYYTEPTPENVAVSLLKAKINNDVNNPSTYLTQDLSEVFTDTDPRNYQLSSYSYFILPTKVRGQFNEAKGRTLGAFAYYAMCKAQQSSASLGYSPLPVNLVTASFEQIKKIPGVEVQNVRVEDCENPTFSPDGTNLLAQNAPFPQDCDAVGQLQCADGTGGLANVPTATANPVATETTVAPTGSGQSGGGQTAGGQATGGQSVEVQPGEVQPGVSQSGEVASGGSSTGGQVAAGDGQAQDGGDAGPTTTQPCREVDPTAPSTTTTLVVALPDSMTTTVAPGVDTTTTTPTTTTSTLPLCEPAVRDSGGGDAAVVDGAGFGASVSGAAEQPVVAVDAIDPATGQAVSPATPSNQQQTAVGGIATVTLDDDTTWAGQVAMILLIVILLVGLVVGPALAWQRLSPEVTP
jgi:phosphate ABC transporter phosphate-binding protein